MNLIDIIIIMILCLCIIMVLISLYKRKCYHCQKACGGKQNGRKFKDITEN